MTEPDDDGHHWYYDHPRTLLGSLQRGHGRGALVARRDRRDVGVTDAVYACIARDHRWDRLVDDCGDYLARLVRDLEMDLTPITDLFWTADRDPDLDDDTSSDEGSFHVTLRVLETLGHAGDRRAVAVLRRAVAEAEHWMAVLEEITYRWPRQTWDDLDTVALARLTAQDEDDVLGFRDPWTTWARRHPRIKDLTRRTAQRPIRPPTPVPRPNDVLVTVLTDPLASRGERSAALRELTRSAPEPRLLELAEDLFGTPLLHRAVSRLGPAVVDHARVWAQDGRMHRFGAALLAEHGTEQDIPRLIEAWDRRWESDDWCGFDDLANGFARFGAVAADAVPRLRAMWRWTPHSYERTACLRALLTVDPLAAEVPLAQGLLDSECDVREFAVAHVHLDHVTRTVLADLAHDPIESPEVRRLAATRLAS
ncbi:hypothetical protein ACFQZ4_14780 [Catellatospora coxensis]|uniref:Uncharacterized protein n=1 Tax=Catellatospora coxensis TaxID=310354 RepID=A0A8J3KP76_9ACTN|nr:hypothetical protein [Catellatospora coxensis]GIG03487.1 hypothetical protein Cco03nite_01870 [Catellatospora coxensis]